MQVGLRQSVAATAAARPSVRIRNSLRLVASAAHWALSQQRVTAQEALAAKELDAPQERARARHPVVGVVALLALLAQRALGTSSFFRTVPAAEAVEQGPRAARAVTG